jgi:hypothetical protein
MAFLNKTSLKRRFMALALPCCIAASVPTVAQAVEVTLRITHVKAADKIDAASPADFLARVTLAGQPPCTTPVVKDQDEIRPTNWICTWNLPHGIYDIKLQIADKDVVVTDLIDINRLPSKRDLDFKVNTRRCLVLGFSGLNRCGKRITRTGDERKKAEITFVVEVKGR